MKTLKDKGSQFFKEKKYQSAIKCYEQYVKDDNPDNDKAFFNNALCYSFLKQHEKAIQNYRKCIRINQTYSKAYYKLMLEFKNIDGGNQYYNIFVTASQFIRYSDSKQFLKQREQAEKNIKTYKPLLNQKLMALIQPQADEPLLKDLQQKTPKVQDSQKYNIQLDKYPDQWITQWKDQIQSEDAKWQQIKYILQQDYDYGVNLAYFYINQVMPVNLSYGKLLAQQLKKIKRQKIFQRKIIKNKNKLTESQESQTQRQDIQKRIDTSHEDRINGKDQTMGGRIKSKKMQFFASLQKSVQTKEQQQKNKKELEQAMQRSQKAIQQIRINTIMSSQQTDLETLYSFFCGKIQTSKDKFAETYRSIISVLKGGQKMQRKGELLILLKKRVKKFSLIVNGFSQKQQQNIYEELVKNKMQEYSNDFAPKHYKQ